MSKPLEEIELFAWLGEDELGSGAIGIKQALCPAGYIPIVAVNRMQMESFGRVMDLQAATYGKRIRLCRFVFAEVIRETPEGV